MRSCIVVVFNHKTEITIWLFASAQCRGRSEWQFRWLAFFYCSLVLISLLKVPKVSEYFGVNRKQLNVATFAALSGSARLAHEGGAGFLHSRSERSFQNCFSGASILDCFSFPISNTSLPCVSPHFLPVPDSTLSHIHLDPCNLLFSPGRGWRLDETRLFHDGKCSQVKRAGWHLSWLQPTR